MDPSRIDNDFSEQPEGREWPFSTRISKIASDQVSIVSMTINAPLEARICVSLLAENRGGNL